MYQGQLNIVVIQLKSFTTSIDCLPRTPVDTKDHTLASVAKCCGAGVKRGGDCTGVADSSLVVFFPRTDSRDVSPGRERKYRDVKGAVGVRRLEEAVGSEESGGRSPCGGAAHNMDVLAAATQQGFDNRATVDTVSTENGIGKFQRKEQNSGHLGRESERRSEIRVTKSN